MTKDEAARLIELDLEMNWMYLSPAYCEALRMAAGLLKNEQEETKDDERRSD